MPSDIVVAHMADNSSAYSCLNPETNCNIDAKYANILYASRKGCFALKVTFFSITLSHMYGNILK